MVATVQEERASCGELRHETAETQHHTKRHIGMFAVDEASNGGINLDDLFGHGPYPNRAWTDVVPVGVVAKITELRPMCA